MYALQLEKEKEQYCNFMSTQEFTNSIIEIPATFYDYNIMVKGSAKTGKTQKIMLPMFNDLNKKDCSKIYFSAKSLNLLDLSTLKCNYFEVTKDNFNKIKQDIYKSINNNENTIVCFGELLESKDLINLYFSEIIQTIANEKKTYFFIDDFQHFPKNNFILNEINKNNHKFYMALEYSNQMLEMNYSKEEKDFIKLNSVSIDTEKQELH